jgi:mRNA interferase MazF
MVSRGEIWWTDLPEPSGSEPGNRHPVLIVQADAFNRSSIATVTAVTLTSNLFSAEAPGNVRLSARKTGLPKDSVANVSQIVTLDKQFLGNKSGKLDRDSLRRVEEGLKLALDLV